MRMRKALNLTSLSKNFGECYVARIVDSDRIIGHSKRADKLMENIKNTEEFKKNKVIISWIPKYGAKYVFGISLLLRTS